MIPPNALGIPDRLTERPQWVCWRLEDHDGDSTKVLYTPETRTRAAADDLMTWTTFDVALAAYEASEGFYDGIGFVFCSADPFVGIDLDSCRDSETGAIKGWARAIIAEAGKGYVEISPSGTGLHIIVEAKLRKGGTRKGPVEMYSRDRCFTITGEAI
jgi:putative DNA primase/helicase